MNNDHLYNVLVEEYSRMYDAILPDVIANWSNGIHPDRWKLIPSEISNFAHELVLYQIARVTDISYEEVELGIMERLKRSFYHDE